MTKKIQITPSILGIDYGRMNEHLAELAPFSDMFHVDVMDGHFVDNLTIGVPVVERIKTNVPLDLHLMIKNPHRYIEGFAKATAKAGSPTGATSITIHAEASLHLSDDVRKIKEAGCRASVAVSPDTSLDEISKVLPMLDMVLVMSVYPGFGGQSFIPKVLEKVKWLREHYPNLDIQVDGGINEETAKLAIEAGANVLVSGSYILKSNDPAKAAASLRP